jgi:hypothetical protein
VKLGPSEGKTNSLGWFLIGIYLPAIAVYLLIASRSLSDYIATSFYVALTTVTLIVLGIFIKSDDQYYQNFGVANLLGSVALALVMTLLSYALSTQIFNPESLLSVNSWGIVAPVTSVSTLFLSTLLFGLVMAATSEELFRLPFFTEGMKRWGKTDEGKTSIKGVLIYVGFPVGFWAALHGIQAYSDPIMIIPAAINGVLLTIYLWKTRCVLGCIFAHWMYNAGIVLVTFLNGTAQVPVGTPILPAIFDLAYYSNSGFIMDFLLGAIVVWGFFFFLLPSLRHK